MHLPALEGQEPSQLCVHDLEWIDTRSPCEYVAPSRQSSAALVLACIRFFLKQLEKI